MQQFIYVAAKSGIPDPDVNQALKKEIEKAKREHIPADVIKRAIEKAKGGQGEGPIPLPTDREVITVIRSPHKHKDSREQFETRTHKRVILKLLKLI